MSLHALRAGRSQFGAALELHLPVHYLSTSFSSRDEPTGKQQGDMKKDR